MSRRAEAEELLGRPARGREAAAEREATRKERAKLLGEGREGFDRARREPKAGRRELADAAGDVASRAGSPAERVMARAEWGRLSSNRHAEAEAQERARGKSRRAPGAPRGCRLRVSSRLEGDMAWLDVAARLRVARKDLERPSSRSKAPPPRSKAAPLAPPPRRLAERPGEVTSSASA